ncbi:MAG TPA: DMT family transporter [Zoogloea sp.]|jgi:drug/metabolite transporter (DMT)-like permease|nr:DMT family transporter [Zoogloea sp.]
MSVADFRRFVACVLIWGTTWLAITFQLGSVAPEASVAWRFALAALISAGICRWQGLGLRFPAAVHGHLLGFGVSMFGVGYLFVYYAESHVASGLVAVGYSVLPLTNMIGTRLAFGLPLNRRAGVGGLIGLFGVACVFWPELASIDASRDVVLGIALTAGGVAASSVGNVFSARLAMDGVQVWQKMAWGMGYGALCCLVAMVLGGRAPGFEWTAGYVLSWLYLAVFGSVFAFFFYLKLLDSIGGGRAGYVGVMTPVLALLLSSLFERFAWSPLSLLGLAAAMAGNFFILRPARAARGA